MSATAEFRPEDRRAAGLFIAALYRSAPSGSLVEVRFRTASGMGQRFHSVSAARSYWSSRFWRCRRARTCTSVCFRAGAAAAAGRM